MAIARRQVPALSLARGRILGCRLPRRPVLWHRCSRHASTFLHLQMPALLARGISTCNMHVGMLWGGHSCPCMVYMQGHLYAACTTPMHAQLYHGTCMVSALPAGVTALACGRGEGGRSGRLASHAAKTCAGLWPRQLPFW